MKNESFFGLRVTDFQSSELMDFLARAIQTGKQVACYGYSLTMLPRLQVFPQIYRIAETCEIMLADGKGFYHLCRLFGIPLQCDWAIYELTNALLSRAATDNFSVMLLGADPENNLCATENLRAKYPGAFVLDGHHGYFSEQEETEVVARINANSPDVLMVGISSPKKEEFLERNRDKLTARVIVLMGGVIDIYAGKTKPIPPQVKKLCLSWLYRFAQEPRRTSVLLHNGLDVTFRLFPAMAWAHWGRKDNSFSIPAFYGVKNSHCGQAS